ncbi:MAG: PP2C family protein-serine/threonine phosphatase [Myxococcota bacterium]
MGAHAPTGSHSLTVGLVCTVGVGPERGGRAGNEDNYLVCRDGRIVWREGEREHVTTVAAQPTTLLAVADGMGGHEDGEIASAAAVQALSRLFLAAAPPKPEEALRHFVLDAHLRLRERLAVDGRVKMGTTLTVAWVIADRCFWVQVGDSRLYHWRRGRIVRVTRDQTRAEFARRDNRAEPQNAFNLSQNFIYGSRGLGDDRGLRLDLGIDTGSFSLQEGDRVVLCTDGLSGRVEDALIADVLDHVAEPGACAVSLMERAIAHHSDDNITVMVARVDRAFGVGAPDPDEWSEEDNTLVPL